MTTNTNSTQALDYQLVISLKGAHLRYERMTAAVLQAVGFLTSTEISSMSGSSVSPVMKKFNSYLAPHQLTFETYFAGMLLTNLITEVEGYFVEAIKLVLQRHPKRLGSTQFKLIDVLDKRPEELVLLAAEEHLLKLMYKRPKEYIIELVKTLAIDQSPLDMNWPAYVEGKARRDIGVHNNWQINAIYMRKLEEVGLSLPELSTSNLQPDLDYIQKLVVCCDKIVREIAVQLEQKYLQQSNTSLP